MLNIHQFTYGGDNYGVLLQEPDSGATALVDAGDATAALAALAETGWSLSQIWLTHHHGDHTAGTTEIVAATGAGVHGPASIASVTTPVADGGEIDFGGVKVTAIATPGHTMDMLNFHIPSEKLLFTGDTLFAMGCGRLFEGDAATMWASLCKLMSLDDETVIYCGHEYTAANADFALSVDPDNDALLRRVAAVRDLRSAGQPSIPTMLALEKLTNPFLRASDPSIRAHLGMADADDVDVFTEIRLRKDNF
ncbi:MAG: hydroxyacylglutathione hydrolase [Rhodospirillaceae bacterium]|nr:hydroxyacylglutathione hydrolase [Rhodospirillaceae bacterium]|tara:strand:- start:423 stop:1175 length:753 start_codon:yes stop_codon:yes gene_type:complete